MSKIKIAIAAVFVAGAVFAGLAIAKDRSPGTQTATQRVLTYLLEISNETIPAASSCHGLFGNSGPPLIKEFLAMELASLNRGRNTIKGACSSEAQGGQCSLTIAHSNGEDVSSAKIMFRIRDDHAVIDSLSCVISL